METTNFANDVKRLFTWFLNSVRGKEHSRVSGFFSKIFREMKR